MDVTVSVGNRCVECGRNSECTQLYATDQTGRCFISNVCRDQCSSNPRRNVLLLLLKMADRTRLPEHDIAVSWLSDVRPMLSYQSAAFLFDMVHDAQEEIRQGVHRLHDAVNERNYKVVIATCCQLIRLASGS